MDPMGYGTFRNIPIDRKNTIDRHFAGCISSWPNAQTRLTWCTPLKVKILFPGTTFSLSCSCQSRQIRPVHCFWSKQTSDATKVVPNETTMTFIIMLILYTQENKYSQNCNPTPVTSRYLRMERPTWRFLGLFPIHVWFYNFRGNTSHFQTSISVVLLAIYPMNFLIGSRTLSHNIVGSIPILVGHSSIPEKKVDDKIIVD